MRKLIALAFASCLLGCSEDSNTVTGVEESLGPHVATLIRGVQSEPRTSYVMTPITEEPAPEVHDFETGEWSDDYRNEELYQIQACVHFRSHHGGEWQQFQCHAGHATGGSLNAGVDQTAGMMSFCGLPGQLVRFTIDVYER